MIFTYKTLNPKELASIVWGSDLSLSLQERKMASQTKEGNYASGGHSIRPFIGYESTNESVVVGGLISYQIFGVRNSSFESKHLKTTTGGNIGEAIGFAEVHHMNYTIGMLTGVEMHGPQSLKEDGDRVDFDPRTYLKANIYSYVNINEGASFAPTLKYRTLTSKNIDGFSINKDEEIELFLGLGITI